MFTDSVVIGHYNF